MLSTVRYARRMAACAVLAATLCTATAQAALLDGAVWFERPVGQGIVWRYYQFDNLFGAKQSVSYMDVNLGNANVGLDVNYRVGAVGPNPAVFPRAKTSVLASETSTARAAINGTYFNTASYNSATPNAVWGGGTTYLKVGNSVVHTFDGTNVNNFGMGLVFDGTKSGLQIRRRPSGGWGTIQSSWDNMMACGPALLVNGAVETYAANNDHANLRHPRSAIGVTLSNHLILLAVDGRTADSAGMSCTELANVMKELGCDDAINMDGGGSTTLWAKGEPFDGVVNYPSDNGVYDHLGERSAANALIVTSTAPTKLPWDGRLTDLSYSTVTRSGDSFTITATYENAGTQTWTPSTVRAVPSRSFGRTSTFVPAGQELTFSSMTPSSVAPGGTATITLNLVPPDVASDTLYIENFALWHSTNGYFGPADNALRVQTTVRPELDGSPAPTIVQGGTTGPNNQWYFETVGSWSNSSVSFTAPGVDNPGTQRYVAATATGREAAFRPIFDVAGPYTVEVAFPSSSNSISVRYQVNHSSGTNNFTINQNSSAGLTNEWQTLGTFQFGTGTSGGAGVHSVTVGNPSTTGNRFYSGAVRFTYAGDLTPPAAPTGLVAVAGNNSVGLDWNNNTESDLAGYNVYRSTTTGGPYTKINGSLLSASAYTDNAAINATTYYYVVRALDSSSPANVSANSAQVSATPLDNEPPAAPAGLAAIAGDGSVSLDWNNNAESDLAGYNVYRSTTSGGSYSKINGSLLSASAYTDNSASNFTTYYYVVRALDNAPSPNTSANSVQVSATPQDITPPAAPTGLLALAGSGSVALDWNSNTEPDLAGYDVYRSTTSGGPYSKINGSLLSASAYTDAAATPSTTYYYVVRAVDSTPNANASGNSAQVSATPFDANNIVIQAEDYDAGGEGVGYHDTTAGNAGGQYRGDDVDISTSSQGGYRISSIVAGEWLKFSNVAGNGSSYRVTASVGSSTNTGAFHVEVNGVDATGLIVFPPTGGVQAWTTIDCGTVALANGTNTIRFVVEAPFGSLDWIKFDKETPLAGIIDWDQHAISGYAGQDLEPSLWRILDNGSTINLWGNTWKRITLNYSANARTTVEFDYKSDAGEPEIGGIAFDDDDVLSDDKSWKVFGTQAWGIPAFDDYAFAGNGWKHYTVPVGVSLAAGTHPYFGVINDMDAGSGANSWYRNVKIYDVPLQTIIVDNDGGSPGFTTTGAWTTSGSTGYNGGSYIFANAGDPRTATWNLNLPNAGLWTIAVQYRSGTNRATSTKYVVQTAAGPVDVFVNQQNNNLAWVNLGTWEFAAGGGSVKLDAAGSTGGTVVIADVVRAKN